MPSIGILQAKTHLSSWVDRARAGEEITLTRHGKPVARLVAIGDSTPRAEEMRRVIAATHRLRGSIKAKGKPIPWSDLKNAGRKW